MMQNIIQCEDSNYFDPSCKTGYYTVGDKNYYRKINALLESSTVKKPTSWNFHYDVFANAIKNPSPITDLNTLYKLRAQQLRDKYDYIILSYSAGSDSDTVLKTFINNGIKLDEVWHDTPLKFLEKSNYIPNYSKDSTNLPSEYFYVVKPSLDKLAQTHPEIKIHFSDSCSDPTEEDREDTSQLLTIPLYFNITKRYRYIDDYIKTLRHPRVCLLMGIDKVIPGYKDKSYGFTFTDNATWNKLPNVEYFYWTPDMPEIVITQARLLWNHLMLTESVTRAKFLIQRTNTESFKNRAVGFDNIVKSVIYPTWDNSTHQVNKYSLFNNEHVKWYNDSFNNEYFFQSWQTNYNESIKKLDPFYAGNNKKDYTDDIVKFFNFHKLGDMNWDI